MDDQGQEYEYGYSSHAVCREIDTLCLQIEELKLTAWDLLQAAQSAMISDGQMIAGEQKIDALAEYGGEVLKITANDLPPRTGPPDPYPGHLENRYWFENLIGAIKVYWKRDVRWDVDSRVLYTIASALRMAGIISCQGWDKIAFLLVLGGVDHKNPRTEIRITKYPEDTIAKLFESP
jgi:hypothetical protein